MQPVELVTVTECTPGEQVVIAIVVSPVLQRKEPTAPPVLAKATRLPHVPQLIESTIVTEQSTCEYADMAANRKMKEKSNRFMCKTNLMKEYWLVDDAKMQRLSAHKKHELIVV